MPTVAQPQPPSDFSKLPELFSYKHVADVTGFSKKSIGRYWKRGEFPAPVRIGGAIRWRKKDILNWLNSLVSDSHS